jgi:hypothetical protein
MQNKGNGVAQHESLFEDNNHVCWIPRVGEKLISTTTEWCHCRGVPPWGARGLVIGALRDPESLCNIKKAVSYPGETAPTIVATAQRSGIRFFSC